MAQSEQQPEATARTPAFNPFVVALREKLDFHRPDDWQPWITRWDRYRVISGLSKRDSAAQVNTLLYAMGREAEDVLASLKLSDEQKLDYDCVKNAFEKHFIPRRNIIYERATFNRRKQESHETVESFVTDHFKLAERCQYGALKDELIRDRLVVGLLDTALSEKLQVDSALTLETAVAAARNSEAVEQQHKEMRDGDRHYTANKRTPATGCGTYRDKEWRMKVRLRKVLSRSSLTFEELSTVVAEMEAVLKSQPLTFLYPEAGGTCESRCLESGVSTDPEPCGFARPRLAVRGFPVSGEKGILVVEPSPG
ncbi:uncharacterized protein ISCGN_016104 [Ixodes scapularis]